MFHKSSEMCKKFVTSDARFCSEFCCIRISCVDLLDNLFTISYRWTWSYLQAFGAFDKAFHTGKRRGSTLARETSMPVCSVSLLSSPFPAGFISRSRIRTIGSAHDPTHSSLTAWMCYFTSCADYVGFPLYWLHEISVPALLWDMVDNSISPAAP